MDTGAARDGTAGHRALAVDLPGHGFSGHLPRGYLGGQDAAELATEPSGIAGTGTADDVAAVVEVLRRVRAHGPTVLTGVSRGGLTLTAVGNAAPELVDHLVYVSAHCPVAATVAEYGAAPENATSGLAALGGLLCADPAAVGALRFNWRTADPALLDTLQETLLADGTRDELLAYLHTQDPDESLLVDDALVRADAATWGTVPRTYVRLTADRALPPALQDRYIAEADALTPENPFRVHSVDTSHLGIQVRPGPLADVLDAVVADRH